MTLLSRRTPSSLPLHSLPKTSSSSCSLPSISTLLRSCKSSGHLQQVHSQILRRGLDQDHFLITQFLCACNALRDLAYAAGLFNGVLAPGISLWNSLIKGHSETASLAATFSFFSRMRLSGTPADNYTFPSLIKACSRDCAIREGGGVHGLSIRCGLDDDLYVRTGLIDMYGKCGEIRRARKVFDEMRERNVVTWTAMVAGYVNIGDVGEAKKLFDDMPQRNVATWNAMIGGFVKLGDLVIARQLFDRMPERNVVSFTVMIDGYAKAGDMASARMLFEQSPKVDVIAWSALISGYAQNGRPGEAVKIFFEMALRNAKPDEFIMVSMMSACSQLGDVELGKWVDSYVGQSAIDHLQPHVCSALVDMNVKCGNMERASQLFKEIPDRDMVTYCSMIKGLSMHGRSAEAVALFSQMLAESLTPDDVAFTVVLTACSHAGLVEEGCYYFDKMINQYSIYPSPDHYACMVDLLGRSGRLEAAYELIKSMPVEPHAGAWGALLGACKLHCDTDLAEVVARRLFTLEPQNAGSYVLLSNVYAAADRWLDVDQLRNEMRENRLRKIPGRSWV